MTRRVLLLAAIALLAGRPLPAQAPLSAAALRTRLFLLADDSMQGRDPGTRGNLLATDYVAAEFRRLGLEPKGESGGYFQVLPLGRVIAESTVTLSAGTTPLARGSDFLPLGGAPARREFLRAPVVYGGQLDEPASWIGPEAAAGHLVILGLSGGTGPRAMLAAANNPHFMGAVALGVVALEQLHPIVRERVVRGLLSVGAPADLASDVPAALLLSRRGAELLLGAPLAGLKPGAAGADASGRLLFRFQPFPLPARNVIAVLPGSDPALRTEFVSVTAHNDHVGVGPAVDHDSIRAFNRVVRPMGADSPIRDATPEEARQIQVLRDSLRRIQPPRADSVLNGADDDGSGTVALLEIARALAAGPRPRRSILFVSHTAEELGLLGSAWFTDHPTVPRGQIVAELDMDMIGRGNLADLPDGGPGYLEVIGARRLSREFGDTLEAVNARQPRPFSFNYAFDAPGHPLQYYCRADHYNYARYGIPATALSRGEHLDYHQVTDEPEYIDYDALARVAVLVRDMAVTVGNMAHRPRLDGPPPDPTAPCRQ